MKFSWKHAGCAVGFVVLISLALVFAVVTLAILKQAFGSTVAFASFWVVLLLVTALSFGFARPS